MNKALNLKEKDQNADEIQLHSQFLEKGIYVKEDDQDWGSAGMNDIQEEFK